MLTHLLTTAAAVLLALIVWDMWRVTSTPPSIRHFVREGRPFDWGIFTFILLVLSIIVTIVGAWQAFS